jgi:hypothetical protein
MDNMNETIQSGQVGRWRQTILWSRLKIAAGTAIAGQKYTFFQTNRFTDPTASNIYEAGRMGPNEAFEVQGISIVTNPNNTAAGWSKLCAEGIFFFGLGTDNIEKCRVPVPFLPSPVGMLFTSTAGPDARSTTPYGFWRLEGDQRIRILAGNVFEASVSVGPLATSLGAGEGVDFYCLLHGVYMGQLSA